MTDTDPEKSAGPHQPLEWRDGDMPYSPAFGDHFYCQTDGRLECGHVFLAGNGLPQRWQDNGDFLIGDRRARLRHRFEFRRNVAAMETLSAQRAATALHVV